MRTFKNYARYYDLLYKDKNYIGEVKYISSLLNAYAPNASSILELGCGTGIHASLLAEIGYEVHGVDMSEDMLESANKRIKSLPKAMAARISFEFGDVRSYRKDRFFDAIVSFFHVISYQTSMNDIQGAFETARSHLNEDGIFIFDFWYGPAVLSEKPEVRIKRLENKKIKVMRIAEPIMLPSENCVEVDYCVFVSDKSTKKIENITEKHKMRYLFLPEVDCILADNNMKRLATEEWMTGEAPGLNTWGVCVVAQAC